MKWKLCFEVNGKTYNAKRKEFESFKEVLNYSKEFSENYIYGKQEKIVAKINSEME